MITTTEKHCQRKVSEGFPVAPVFLVLVQQQLLQRSSVLLARGLQQSWTMSCESQGPLPHPPVMPVHRWPRQASHSASWMAVLRCERRLACGSAGNLQKNERWSNSGFNFILPLPCPLQLSFPRLSSSIDASHFGH